MFSQNESFMQQGLKIGQWNKKGICLKLDVGENFGHTLDIT